MAATKDLSLVAKLEDEKGPLRQAVSDLVMDAMAKDMKLNKMQHSPGVLKKMVESYFAYPNLIDGEGRRDFHSVQKKG